MPHLKKVAVAEARLYLSDNMYVQGMEKAQETCKDHQSGHPLPARSLYKP